jgi:hypothetical protein
MFARAVEALIADPRFRPGMPILFDDYTADVRNVSVEDVKTLAGHFVWLSPQLGPGRAAMLVSEPITFGVARMFEQYASNASLTFGVFYLREEAVQWLLGRSEMT